MFYIVALGNPGDKYKLTRHNIGWLVLDLVRANTDASELQMSKMIQGRIGQGLLADQSVQYLYPETYMNKSGQAVRAIVNAEEINRLIVLHDDIALPFGQIKVSFGRGSGGQNGVQSIIDAIGSKDFVRIRLGVATRSFWTGKIKRPTGESLATYVLARLSKSEQTQVSELAVRVQAILETIVQEGYVVAMNTYNSTT